MKERFVLSDVPLGGLLAELFERFARRVGGSAPIGKRPRSEGGKQGVVLEELIARLVRELLRELAREVAAQLQRPPRLPEAPTEDGPSSPLVHQLVRDLASEITVQLQETQGLPSPPEAPADEAPRAPLTSEALAAYERVMARARGRR